jgi:putative ABC transport system permease protein
LTGEPNIFILQEKHQIMFISFLKLTLRNFRRQGFSSFVNIAGLALGFASFILISLYVYDESRYDLFQEKGDRIYRLSNNTFHPDRILTNAPALLYEPLLMNLPEAEKVVRIIAPYRDVLLERGDLAFREPGTLFVDPAFFDVFSFRMERGDLATFTDNPQSVMLTPYLANKYFGQEDPIGQTIRYKGFLDLVVTGIMEEVPQHSHIQFSMLVNFEARRQINPHVFESWGNYSGTYYLLLRPDADPLHTAETILTIWGEARDVDYAERGAKVWLQPMKEIYMRSGHLQSSFPVLSGSPSAVSVFSISAILILILACFNYANLATAKSTIRAREVGVRKVLGAGRNQLVGLFLIDSFMMSVIAMVVAFGLVELSLPFFATISGKEISISIVSPIVYAAGLLILLLLVSLIAGLYPAFVLSGFKPIHVLKGSGAIESVKGRLGVNLRFRQLLIVLQFAISIGLVSASLILYDQTNHALSNSGFNQEALVVVRNTWDQQMNARYYGFRDDLQQYPFVTAISAGLNVPTEHIGNQGYLRETDKTADDAQLIVFNTVDFDYFEILGAAMAEGRSFDRSYATDSTEAVVINQSAARVLELTNPVGTTLTGFWDGVDKKVIGVVEDIHFQSVHRLVQPAAFTICFGCKGYPSGSANLLVKIQDQKLTEAVEAIKDSWDAQSPGEPLDFFFMDSQYENMYRKELQTAAVARVFTILAVVIACMGLLGTTVYVMESRKKEFGVRKVLGASVMRLANMISTEFSLLILLSNLIAWPIAWFFMSRWLDTFVYRIDMSAWYFVVAGLAGWLLTMVTVNSLAVRQAGKDPVQALKYE